MKPQRILIARHGESEGNIDKTAYARIPDYALPLTTNGRQQAEELGRKISELIGDERIHFYFTLAAHPGNVYGSNQQPET